MNAPRAKHIFGPPGYHMWQVTVLGIPVRSGINFPTIEDAAFNCQLFKHYLHKEFRLEFQESQDGEIFTMLAHRRSVSLPDSRIVFSSLPESAQQFIHEQNEKLVAHRESVPETVASKFRRSGMMEDPRIREWVNKCDAAEIVAKEYATVNSDSFFTRLSVVDRSLDASLKSLALAVRLHGDQPPASLAPRVAEVSQLIKHLTETQSTVRNLTARLKNEQSNAESALTALEANRPPLIDKETKP